MLKLRLLETASEGWCATHHPDKLSLLPPDERETLSASSSSSGTESLTTELPQESGPRPLGTQSSSDSLLSLPPWLDGGNSTAPSSTSLWRIAVSICSRLSKSVRSLIG